MVEVTQIPNEKNKEGEKAFSQGQIHHAQSLFLEVIQLDPRNDRAFSNLGVICWQQGNLPDALALFSKALELNPQNRTALDNKGEIEKILNSNPILPNAKFADQKWETSPHSSGNLSTPWQTNTLDKSMYSSPLNYTSFYQPPRGNTETYIQLKPIGFDKKVFPVGFALSEYQISGSGMGQDAIDKIVDHIFKNKIGIPKTKNWEDLLNQCIVTQLHCQLQDREGHEFKFSGEPDLESIHPIFAKNEGPERANIIFGYRDQLKRGENLGSPLYLTGEVLNLFGANLNSFELWQLDGARRLTASVLAGKKTISILCILTETQYGSLIKTENKQALEKAFSSQSWFKNYQTIPLAGLKGERTSKRFDYIPWKNLVNQNVLDFGCNIGQACFKAALSGVKKVVGLEGMPDTYGVAKQIKDLAPLPNLDFCQIDFNDPHFPEKINQFFPEQADFSFFFSVYRTKELQDRDKLFRYIIEKTEKGIFFEGHAHEKIDCIEYYEWLFESFGLPSRFLGFSEGNLRPFFYLDLSQVKKKKPEIIPNSIVNKAPEIASGKPNYLVSALVSVYNSSLFIEHKIKDLLRQTLGQELEIIIIDSGSSENEAQILKPYLEVYPNIVYLRTQERETIYQAWNRGIQIARGKYITNSNTDDRLRPDALAIMATALENSPSEIGLVYGDLLITNLPNQTWENHIRTGYSLKPEYDKSIMNTGCHMGPHPMWRKSIHTTLGNFNGELKSAGDFDFWSRLATQYTMKHLPEFLCLYYHNPQGMVNSAPQLSQQESISVLESNKLKFPQPDSHFKTPTGVYYKSAHVPADFVNIGMITYNRLDFTKQSIKSLVEMTQYPYKFTVVDNNSTDGTKEYLQELKNAGIIHNLVLLEENIGVARASNIAWNIEPEANYYLKLDNDIVLQKPNWLNNMIEVLKRSPSIGVLGYNFEPVSYPLQTIQGVEFRPKTTGNLGGALNLIPRRLKETFGGWCEDYGLYGEEDADWGERVASLGLLNAYMPDEEVGIHLPAGKAAAINKESLVAKDGQEEYIHKEYREWKDQLRKKHVEPNSVFVRNCYGYQAQLLPIHVNNFISRKYTHILEYDFSSVIREDGKIANLIFQLNTYITTRNWSLLHKTLNENLKLLKKSGLKLNQQLEQINPQGRPVSSIEVILFADGDPQELIHTLALNQKSFSLPNLHITVVYQPQNASKYEPLKQQLQSMEFLSLDFEQPSMRNRLFQGCRSPLVVVMRNNQFLHNHLILEGIRAMGFFNLNFIVPYVFNGNQSCNLARPVQTDEFNSLYSGQVYFQQKCTSPSFFLAQGEYLAKFGEEGITPENRVLPLQVNFNKK